MLTFRPNDVVAHRADRTVTAPYGQMINLGVVQFSVRSRPAIETATLGIGGRESAIDGLLAGLLVARRTETDVIDVGYTAYDPVSAQRIVNATVQAFQTLNVQWARERSRRRREFLGEQLAQTDSMLARAQGELANFRSRQQLASSADKLKAEQETRSCRSRPGWPSSMPTGETFTALQQQLKSGDEAGPGAGHSRAGHRPWHGDNQAVGTIYHQLLIYQDRLDSMTTGPWKASATNPDVIQLKGLAAATTEQAGGRRRQPDEDAGCPMDALGSAAAAERRLHPGPARHGRGGDAAQPSGGRAGRAGR